jgi:ERCC4-related helicase
VCPILNKTAPLTIAVLNIIRQCASTHLSNLQLDTTYSMCVLYPNKMSNIINLKPRDYQQAIFNTAKDNNTLVVLPTGVGKTLIALLLTIEKQKQFPGSKALFLAPTRPLVEQHLQTFKAQLPELFADLQIFTGSIQAPQRKKIFQTADIIFSTPQCVDNDLKNRLYDLSEVSLLILDECHRCIKNYSYTNVVNYYKQQAENQRILGLTASPGSDLPRVKEICKHLDIEKVESRTRDSPDVRPYLQTLDFEKVEVPFPKEFEEIRVLLKKIYDEKVNKLREKNILFGPANKFTLLKLQSKLFARLSQGSRDFQAMHAVSQTAQAIKISHALELLETQTLSSLNIYLQEIVKQANEKKSRAVQQIYKDPNFNAALLSLKTLLTLKTEHPKVDELSTIIHDEFSHNPNAKIIIFAQFRETISLLAKRLNEIPQVKAKVFLGQAKKSSKTGSSGLSQKEQKEIIEEFSEGKINVLCATSIGEEGLDIPEVSAVIFYEPIPSAIRSIQRRGRTARLAPGKLLILMTKDTRDIAYHYAAKAKEKRMASHLETVKDELNNKNPTLDKFK